jgi:hypothetical protein
MTDEEIMLLRNCMVLQDKCESSSETCPTSHDANEIISIKVEGVSYIEKEEDHVELRFSGIKTEHEVSCMSVSLLGKFQKYPELRIVCHVRLCLPTSNHCVLADGIRRVVFRMSGVFLFMNSQNSLLSHIQLTSKVLKFNI